MTDSIELREVERRIQVIEVWMPWMHGDIGLTEQGSARLVFEGAALNCRAKIAKTITGAHWSGPRFFGLVRAGTSSERGTGDA